MEMCVCAVESICLEINGEVWAININMSVSCLFTGQRSELRQVAGEVGSFYTLSGDGCHISRWVTEPLQVFTGTRNS